MFKSVWFWCAVLTVLDLSAAGLVAQDQIPTKEGVAQEV